MPHPSIRGALVGRIPDLRQLRDRTLRAVTGDGDTVTCDQASERIVIRHRRRFRRVTRSVARSSIEGVELLARGRRNGRSHIRIRCADGDRIEIRPTDRLQGRSLDIACAVATFSGHPLHMVHQ